jgi:hypothetical protein
MVCTQEAFYELRDLGKEEMRSVDAEDFATTMQMLHEQVKGSYMTIVRGTSKEKI